MSLDQGTQGNKGRKGISLIVNYLILESSQMDEKNPNTNQNQKLRPKTDLSYSGSTEKVSHNIMGDKTRSMYIEQQFYL